MNASELFISLLFGIVAGSLYGLSFFKQKQKALTRGRSANHTWPYAQFLYMTMVRVVVFGIALYLLLLSRMIHFILFLVTFLATFWLFIFKHKEQLDGRDQGP